MYVTPVGTIQTPQRSPSYRRYVLLLAAVWTLVIVVLFLWNYFRERDGARVVASEAAREQLTKDVIYRRWNAGHGGVYVPVTDSCRPNPYLIDVEERDILTPSGRWLTLINPAFMTRQVHTLGLRTEGKRGHITSLNPLNPVNVADPWEKQALESFELGEQEFASIETIKGEAHLRLMQPLIIEKDCLKCHAGHGYREGDVRGGISVSVPMTPYAAIAQKHMMATAVGHAALWSLGLAALFLGAGRIRRHVAERDRVEEVLTGERQRLASIIEGANVGTWEWNVQTGAITYNERWAAIIGRTLADISPVSVDTWRKLTHPDDLKVSRELLEKHFTGELDYYECETRLRHQNDDWAWVLDRGKVATWTAAGKPLMMFGTSLDITGRKQVEEELKVRLSLEALVGRFAAELAVLPVEQVESGIERTLEAIARHAGAVRGSVFIFSDDMTTLTNTHEWCSDIADTQIEQLQDVPSETFGYYMHLLQRHENVVIGSLDDLPGKEAVKEREWCEQHGFRPLLFVPMTSTGGLRGALGFYGEIGQQRSWSDNLVPLLRFVADLLLHIIEHQRAEEALQENEGLLRKIAENYPHSYVSIIDNNYTIRFASGQEYAKQQLDPEQFVGQTLEQVFGDQAAVVRQNYENTFQGEERAFELFINNQHQLYHTVPLYAEDGSIPRILAVVENITDRKLAEEAFIDSQHRYQELFDSVMEGISIVDENEIIKFANPALVKIFGENSVNDMLGKNLLEYFPESQQNIIRSETGKRVTGDSSQYKLEMITAAGEKKHLYVSITPRLNKNKEYLGAFGTVLDITETKRLQDREAKAARLEMAGTIAGQVAHDFNNLLAPLIAYPDFIRDVLPRDHKAQAYLDAIEDAAEKIVDINQDLLTMGRRGHYHLETIDINRVVTHAAREMELRIKTVTCEMDLDENLKKAKGGYAQLHRMLSNLLVNACDAMQDIGKITIKTENYYVDQTAIVFGRVPKGEYVKLTVADEGCGIPEELIGQILEPFFTTKNADKQRGSGLGLSVVDAVMKDHNGYLDISSKVGNGTSFYLYFPVTREDVTERDSEQIICGTESVLVVDDDEIQREVTTKLLAKLGYRATAVESGREAVKFLRENPQDVLVLDMVMPEGMDGAETYRQALTINPRQKAIILSGFSESERTFTAQKLGAGAFVKKPISKNIIAAAVRTELDRQAKVLATEIV